MTFIQNASIHYNEQGTPVSDAFDDVYFSNESGLHETQYVFLTQNGLPQRFASHSRRQFHVMETGFGTGLNFLALWRAFNQFRQQTPQAVCQQLHFSTFEKFPLQKLDLANALQKWPELQPFAMQLLAQYPEVFVPGCNRLQFGEVSLDLWLGDVHDNLPNVADSSIVDAWFLDGFAPSKNPDMWQDTLWQGLARLSRYETTIATFTSAGLVRRGIESAGFVVKKVKGYGRKREMAVAFCTSGQPLPVEWPFANCPPAPSINQDPLLQTIADVTATPTSSGGSGSPTAQNDAVACHLTAAAPSPVLIVGGGLASITLALSLLERGQAVHLVCKDTQLGLGASHNRQGALYPQLQHKLTPMSLLHIHAFLFAGRRYLQWRGLFEFPYERCGVIQLACNEQLSVRQQKIAQCTDFPTGLWQQLTGEQASVTAGVDVPFGGMYFPTAGWIAPQVFCQAAVAYLQSQAGFELSLECEVVDFKRESDGFTVSTNQQQLHTAQLIWCVGNPLPDWAFASHLPMSQVRGQVSHVSADGLSGLKTVLCHQGYITPYDSTRNLAQACVGASFDRDCALPELKPSDDEANLQLVNDVLHQPSWFQQATVHSAKAGVRSTVRDHVPVVGAIEPALWVFGGLGARGLLFAPLLADHLAAAVTGQVPPLNQQLQQMVDVKRFDSYRR